MLDQQDYLMVDAILEAFPASRPFAEACHLPKRFNTYSAPGLVMESMEGLKRPINYPDAREHQQSWQVGSQATGCNDPIDRRFQVPVVMVAGEPRILVGSLLATYGSYVEMVAAGKSYGKGYGELRGTSFDQAVKLMCKATGWLPTDTHVIDAANCLTANLNGAWLQTACAMDPHHVVANLILDAVQLMEERKPMLMMILNVFATRLARVICTHDFFDDHVEEVGWINQKSMCLTMDAATTLLLRQMTEDV